MNTQQVLEVISKHSDKKWFEKNQEALKKDLDLIPSDSETETQTQLKEAQQALSDSIQAKTDLHQEYVKTHSALMDVATKVTGETDLRKHAPLTPDKLHSLITTNLHKVGKVAGDVVSKAKILELLKRHKSEVQTVGAGPLAMGRSEGAKDTCDHLTLKIKSL